jgi:AT hook motif
MNEDLRQLRKKFDSNDSFMTRGYQIKKIRTRQKEIPAWAINNEGTKKVLLRAFPKLASSVLQRKRAARWGLIIHLFYRVNMTKSQVAAELKTKPTVINRVLQSIRACAKGTTGTKPRGRPRKSAVSSPPPL